MKEEFETQSGVSRLVQVFKSNSHILLNWNLKNWGNMSTVQIRVIEKRKQNNNCNPSRVIIEL